NTDNITVEQLRKLKELAEICYIDFNENPVIDGTITRRGNGIKDELKNIIGELPTNYYFQNSGLIFLTLEEWENVKRVKGISFAKSMGAIFPIKSSVAFLISSYYRNINITQTGSKITVEGALHTDVFRIFNEQIGLKKQGNTLFFRFRYP